jgi:hypothetical protein
MCDARALPSELLDIGVVDEGAAAAAIGVLARDPTGIERRRGLGRRVEDRNVVGGM